jgi:hypothetical protein
MLKKIITLKREIARYSPLTPASQQSWKYFFRWIKTLDVTKTSIDYGLPWFSFQAIDYIKENLPNEARVFEFGGGGSTIFFERKKCEIHTVEHHKEWFANIAGKFKAMEFPWNGYLIEPDKGDLAQVPEIGNPLHYSTDDSEYHNMNFKKYATKIDEFEDGYFDLVLVDGRSRPSCTYHAIPKIKSGGMLIIDNTEREYYLEYFEKNFADKFEKVLDVYGPVPYITWFHKTSVFRKK